MRHARIPGEAHNVDCVTITAGPDANMLSRGPKRGCWHGCCSSITVQATSVGKEATKGARDSEQVRDSNKKARIRKAVKLIEYRALTG